jgi:hypothetical protein
MQWKTSTSCEFPLKVSLREERLIHFQCFLEEVSKCRTLWRRACFVRSHIAQPSELCSAGLVLDLRGELGTFLVNCLSKTMTGMLFFVRWDGQILDIMVQERTDGNT